MRQPFLRAPYSVIYLVAALLVIVAPMAGGVAADTETFVHLRSSDIKSELMLDNVQSVEAEAYNIPEIAGSQADIPRIVIPVESLPSILSLFKDPEIDTSPSISIREIATIKIKFKDSSTRTIVCFWKGGKGPLHFSINGIRCIAERQQPPIDAGLTLIARLRGIQQENTK